MNKPIADIEIVGGHPAVDFVNTVHNWVEPEPADYLQTFGGFLDWCLRIGLLWPKAAKYFQARPQAEQEAALDELRSLRASLHDLFAALAAGERLQQKALDHLNGIIRRTVSWRCLAADPQDDCRSLCCLWEFSGAPALAAVGPIAWKAAELLELGDAGRLKVCPGETCGWLFIDTSKNRSRHWCSMRTCGNAAKVRRFRERNRMG